MSEEYMIEQYKNGDNVFIFGEMSIFVGIDPRDSKFGIVEDPNDGMLKRLSLDNMAPGETTIALWEEEERSRKKYQDASRDEDASCVKIPRSRFPFLLNNEDRYGSEYVPEDILFYMRGQDFDQTDHSEYSTCRECGGPDVFIGMDEDIMPIRSWCEHCEFLASKDVDPPEMLNEIHAYLEGEYPDWKFITNDSFSLTAVLGKHEIKIEVKGTRR